MKISMKKRKIGYTYSSLSGVYSFRAEKSIYFESSLERDLLTILEFNDRVVDVEEQPFTLEYEDIFNGKIRKYTPDFLVHFKTYGIAQIDKISVKPLIIEVKPREKLQKHFHEFKPKFKAMVSYANQNDMRFKIYDETRIRDKYFNNIKFLKKYKLLEYEKIEEDRIINYLGAVGHTAIDHLLEFLYVTDEQRGLGLGQLWHLVSTKKINCDLTIPLNLGTIIWLNTERKGY